MTTATVTNRLDFGAATVHRNASTPRLVEIALARGEGVLASNGALCVDTGDFTGRSPNDKFLEDVPEIHDKIDWGKVNRPVSPDVFAELEARAYDHMSRHDELFRFDGYCGADPKYSMKVTVVAEKAWNALFAQTLFINADPSDLPGWEPEWTIIIADTMRIDDWKDLGLNSNVAIIESLTQKKVVIIGSAYAGEIKKSIFYANNYQLLEKDVFPMHCSCNVDDEDPTNVALFFGLSGTGKTTLSADEHRPLVGDDEHGWSKDGVFNIEGGCYAKCIRLSREGEPQIWDAIRFGSVLENVILDPETRVPDYDDGSKTENTRVTYPVEHIPHAVIPSVAAHPKNVLFLTADAFGVLPPVSKLTREQAMYYFINGYTSKLAGTERGVTEPQPNFSPCFGGPFISRPPMVYAEYLAKRIEEHGVDVWLINTGWSGGPHGVGKRFKLEYTRAFVTAILDGSLRDADFEQEPHFGLFIPKHAPNVPDEVLNPRNTWKDKNHYDEKAKELGGLFRKNDQKYELSDKARKAGPRV
jgi:phosphoenolpyruvate carboxykinase (ATP)